MDKVHLIYKVLAGKASETERIELDNWLAKNKDNKIEFDDIKLLFENERSDSVVEQNDHFNDGLLKIKDLMLKKTSKQKHNMALFTIAVITILVCGGVFIYFFVTQPDSMNSSYYLKFDNASLKVIIDDLEKKYRVKIEVEEKEIMSCRFTGSFYRTESAKDIVESLAAALNLQVESLNNQQYRILGMGCLKKSSTDSTLAGP